MMIKKKSDRKLIWFVLIGAFLIVLVGLAGSYTLAKEREGQDAELAVWESALQENDITSYANYLFRYPEGKYEQEAVDRMNRLRKEMEIWN